MRPFGLVAVVLFLGFAVSMGAQTPTGEVEIGAELEVLTRHPDLTVAASVYGPESSTELSEMPEPGDIQEASAEGTTLPIAHTLYARARSYVVADNGSVRARAYARARVELWNNRDDAFPVRLRLAIPGSFLATDPPRFEPNDYYARGWDGDNFLEAVRASQVINIFIPGTTTPLLPFSASHQVGPWGEGEGSREPGPQIFNIFGIPFFREFDIEVPPTARETVVGDEVIIDFHPAELLLSVSTSAHALTFTASSASEAVELAAPSCPGEMTRVGLDPLCRAGRARGDAPACNCTRDLQAGRQNCSYNFSDLLVRMNLNAPGRAGEKIDVDWTLLPWPAAEGEYSLRAELLVNGKWSPIDSKIGGKLSDGKESRARLSFTMPQQPTVLRTTLIHQPKGAKQPIESKIDTRIGLRRAKPKGK